MSRYAYLSESISAALVLFVLLPETTGAQPRPAHLDCDRVGSITSRFLEESLVPGAAVAVVRDGEPLCVLTRGTANLELQSPVTRETVFELASLTKQMTSALVVTLAEEGEISLDERLVTYIGTPTEAWSAITVRQLLGHMGGLRHKFEPKFHGSYLVDYRTEVMLSAAAETPMVSEPGTDWTYSDQGYFLAGLALERITGRKFADLMTERFFAPLGMSRTRFLDQDEIIPGRASGYTVVDGEIKNNRRVWEFELTPHFGVMSTIDDMVRWERGLSEATVVSSGATDRITTPYRVFHEGENHVISYGMGWQIHAMDGRRIAQHAGYTGTYYLRDLTTGLSVIVLTNRDSNAGPHPSRLAMKLARLADPSFPAIDG